MSFPPPLPPKFRVGDRVADGRDTDVCGKVVAITQTGPAGAQYTVRWENTGAEGPLTDQTTVRCPETQHG
jgi:hypothetical protein